MKTNNSDDKNVFYITFNGTVVKQSSSVFYVKCVVKVTEVVIFKKKCSHLKILKHRVTWFV